MGQDNVLDRFLDWRRKPNVQIPDLYRYSLRKDGYISEFYSSSGSQIVFRRNLNDWELETFCELLHLLGSMSIEQNKKDNLI